MQIFTSEQMTDTNERIKLIVSGKVYNQSYNDVDFFIHRAGYNQWQAVERKTGRALIAMRKTKKQSIADTKTFIDHIKDVSGLLDKIANDQINDRFLTIDDLDDERKARFNGV